eukprot:TRINITY_DN30088_c0_g1_i2.p1 TRINITY_DN30088_c0_g1~~TRINITY_DN30088_c0_g1_i2.p1  ORF type:complete len:281 (-),score=39.32 TRINITY_DN30088_c0_g1_i2:39-881(-)
MRPARQFPCEQDQPGDTTKDPTPGWNYFGFSLVPFEFDCRVIELCGRLFQKLDAFEVGQLAFVELACGLSALSLGTMEEKLQVCFDLFDSEGRRALTLKDLCELCAVLFRVALAQGLRSSRRPYTDEDLCHKEPTLTRLLSHSQASTSSQRAASFSVPSSPARSRGGSFVVFTDEEEEYITPARLHVERQPWRSMLLRLLTTAQVRVPGGPWLVAFDDFCQAARMEPALLYLFSWCLPRSPSSSIPILALNLDEPPVSPASRLCIRIKELCKFFLWKRRE